MMCPPRKFNLFTLIYFDESVCSEICVLILSSLEAILVALITEVSHLIFFNLNSLLLHRYGVKKANAPKSEYNGIFSEKWHTLS